MPALDKPDADGVQQIRSPNAIAKLQNINQTIFHSLCSYTFDPDEGYCAFDRVNDPDTFGFISQILPGSARWAAIVLDGTDTIRAPSDGVNQRQSVLFLNSQFLAANPLVRRRRHQDLGLNLQPEQAALLGCGAAYASPCSASSDGLAERPRARGLAHAKPRGWTAAVRGDRPEDADGQRDQRRFRRRESAIARRAGRHEAQSS